LPSPLPVLAEVWRGKVLESVHHGAAVVVDSSGDVLDSIGPSDLVTTLRSAAKPLQAIPLLTLPGAAELDLSDEELAICCASHPGEPRHAALAASVLALSGYLPDDLVCGSAGEPPSPLKHGCSGNHAAILLAARLLDAPLDGYHLPDHPVQRHIFNIIREVSGSDSVVIATDGCGIPTFGLTIRQMACAFARLVSPLAAWRRIPQAIASYPELIGAPDRIDVCVMKATSGRIIAKGGAEGLMRLADRTNQLGMAIKIADGSIRALGPVTIALLMRYGWISGDEAESSLLRDLRTLRIFGPDGSRTGDILPSPALES
jgi:L-asparaginase II